MYQEFSQLICENYHLLSESEKNYYDSKGNYLFISQIDQGISKEELDKSTHNEQTRDAQSSKLAELEQRRFGPRIGVHRILDLLKKWDAPATFFVPGQTAAYYPDLLSIILQSGFEISLHGYQHERVDELSIDENIDVLERLSLIHI